MQMAYSIQQLGEITGVGRTTIYAAIRNGHLKARKIGRRTVILHDDLHAFLKSLPQIAVHTDKVNK
jgi:excisionase family DNA binding protein